MIRESALRESSIDSSSRPYRRRSSFIWLTRMSFLKLCIRLTSSISLIKHANLEDVCRSLCGRRTTFTDTLKQSLASDTWKTIKSRLEAVPTQPSEAWLKARRALVLRLTNTMTSFWPSQNKSLINNKPSPTISNCHHFSASNSPTTLAVAATRQPHLTFTSNLLILTTIGNMRKRSQKTYPNLRTRRTANRTAAMTQQQIMVIIKVATGWELLNRRRFSLRVWLT